jgi:hypothetical protein
VKCTVVQVQVPRRPSNKSKRGQTTGPRGCMSCRLAIQKLAAKRQAHDDRNAPETCAGTPAGPKLRQTCTAPKDELRRTRTRHPSKHALMSLVLPLLIGTRALLLRGLSFLSFPAAILLVASRCKAPERCCSDHQLPSADRRTAQRGRLADDDPDHFPGAAAAGTAAAVPDDVYRVVEPDWTSVRLALKVETSVPAQACDECTQREPKHAAAS